MIDLGGKALGRIFRAVLGMAILFASAKAEVVRFEIGSVEPFAEGKAFGAASETRTFYWY